MTYVIERGLCKVRPYLQTKSIFCKERWLGHTVEAVLAAEFKNRGMAAHARAIGRGEVALLRRAGRGRHKKKGHQGQQAESTFRVERVAGAQVAAEVIRAGDVIEYQAHVHEPPVACPPWLVGWMEHGGDCEGLVLEETADTLVIDKPAGVPVHPTGRYNENSLTVMLEHLLGYKVYASHRLDRLTSGLLILGKTSGAAAALSQQLRDKVLTKEYLALVRGVFPADPVTCSAPIFTTQFSDGLAKFVAGLGASKHAPKPAATVVARVWCDARRGVSLVRCTPQTGRTHQIRKHLALLGHPIANDPVYAMPEFVRLSRAVNKEGSTRDPADMDEIVALFNAMAAKVTQGIVAKQKPEPCAICEGTLFEDPDADSLAIFLHARRYAAQDKSFDYECPLPEWALQK